MELSQLDPEGHHMHTVTQFPDFRDSLDHIMRAHGCAAAEVYNMPRDQRAEATQEAFPEHFLAAEACHTYELYDVSAEASLGSIIVGYDEHIRPVLFLAVARDA